MNRSNTVKAVFLVALFFTTSGINLFCDEDPKGKCNVANAKKYAKCEGMTEYKETTDFSGFYGAFFALFGTDGATKTVEDGTVFQGKVCSYQMICPDSKKIPGSLPPVTINLPVPAKEKCNPPTRITGDYTGSSYGISSSGPGDGALLSKVSVGNSMEYGNAAIRIHSTATVIGTFDPATCYYLGNGMYMGPYRMDGQMDNVFRTGQITEVYQLYFNDDGTNVTARGTVSLLYAGGGHQEYAILLTRK
jgi:hypothetical protein